MVSELKRDILSSHREQEGLKQVSSSKNEGEIRKEEQRHLFGLSVTTMEARVLFFFENYDLNFRNLELSDDLIAEDKKIVGNIDTSEGQLQLGYKYNCEQTIPKFREFLEKEEKKEQMK